MLGIRNVKCLDQDALFRHVYYRNVDFLIESAIKIVAFHNINDQF